MKKRKKIIKSEEFIKICNSKEISFAESKFCDPSLFEDSIQASQANSICNSKELLRIVK